MTGQTRRHRLFQLLEAHKRTLPDEDREQVEAVAESIHADEPIAQNTAAIEDDALTFGQRAADRVASFGGSWTFIMLFAGVIVCWMIVNVVFLAKEAFDPYPFILLNLVLSCLAAIQAPIIMMSQKRQDERDRISAENDYRVNLKAEIEIREMREAMERLHLEHATLIESLRADLRQES